MELSKKAAYIRGLVECMSTDENTPEGKIIRAMSELLGEMADAVQELDEDLSQAYNEINDLSDELEALEGDIYDDGADSDESFHDDDSSGPYYEVACPNCGETVYVSEDDLDAGEAVCGNCKAEFEVTLADDEDEADGADEGPVRYELTCPNCGETSEVDEDELLEGQPVCPNCGASLDLDVTEEK